MHHHNLLLFLLLLLLPPPGVFGFAAKKGSTSKNKKKGGGAGFKGFGAKPPTLAEVVSKLKTRVPSSSATDPDALPCPCGSGATYGDCCGPYHRGLALPQNPLDVLRSRYTAFAWRLPSYVMETTHPECRDYRTDQIEWVKDLDKSGMFDSYTFVELLPGIEEAGSDENEGFIEFKVRLEAKDSTATDIGGRETILSERSRFLRDGDPATWRYAGGDVRSDVEGLEDAVLNR